jgi:hypothetical protein
MKYIFLLLQIAVAYTNHCIVFYTGGSNAISPLVYSDFLSNLENIDVFRIPFQCNKNKDRFFKDLKKKYSSINLLAHSSGCTRAVNNCNNDVDSLILLDPVKTPYWDSEKNLHYLSNILIINAEKSYKWSLIPPFVPFIPFFRVNPSDINIDKNKVKILTIHKYGHSDIIDKPYRDLMHYSRISVGHNKRNNIEKYHKFLSNVIISYINEMTKKNSDNII